MILDNLGGDSTVSSSKLIPNATWATLIDMSTAQTVEVWQSRCA